jgi:hypothetical protein
MERIALGFFFSDVAVAVAILCCFFPVDAARFVVKCPLDWGLRVGVACGDDQTPSCDVELGKSQALAALVGV